MMYTNGDKDKVALESARNAGCSEASRIYEASHWEIYHQ